MKEEEKNQKGTELRWSSERKQTLEERQLRKDSGRFFADRKGRRREGQKEELGKRPKDRKGV